MNDLVANFFAASAGYCTALDQIDADQPIDNAAASAASAACLAERDAIRAVVAVPIATAEDAAAAASVLAHLLAAEAWPVEARTLARALGAAVDRLTQEW